MTFRIVRCGDVMSWIGDLAPGIIRRGCAIFGASSRGVMAIGRLVRGRIAQGTPWGRHSSRHMV